MIEQNNYEEAVEIALRTQQIIGYESSAADTIDPLAGSYFIEHLTDRVEKEAWAYIEQIEEIGQVPNGARGNNYEIALAGPGARGHRLF